MLAPARRRGIEILDDGAVDDETRRRSLDDVARSNRWLGGRRAVRLALDRALAASPARTHPLIVLDVGTGAGDLALLARERGARIGRAVHVVGLDVAESLAREARTAARLHDAVVADALALPVRDGAADVVVCSQLLHHFELPAARALLRELHRVARGAVIVADLRRSWLAAIGFWLVSWPLRFSAVTRHDGVVSVLRGFTARELESLVREAAGRPAVVRRRLGWRLVAAWRRA